MAELTKIKDLSDWLKTRRQIESSITQVLGSMPKGAVDLQVKVMDEVDGPGYVRRRINYFVDEWIRVSAWMFVPDGKDAHPAIVCCHRMTVRGKDESAGLEGAPTLAFARRFAERGYVTIAADCITAGDRISSGLEPFDTKGFYKDYSKMSAMGKMLSDHMRCIDVLVDNRAVDPARIGVVGHDMGGYNALFLAAFDERVQACVSSCGFTRFADDPDVERWCRPNGFVLLPKLKEAVAKKEFPFDWEHLLALAAPIPTLIAAASNDEVFGNSRSCEKAVKSAQSVYKLLGAEDALSLSMHNEGHQMTHETLEAADEWLDRWL